MKIIATRKSDQNHAAVDPWTVVHFGAGLAAGLLEISFPAAMLAAGAYELFEQAIERSDPGQEFFKTSGPETIPNVIVDLGIFGLGLWLGRRWSDT